MHAGVLKIFSDNLFDHLIDRQFPDVQLKLYIYIAFLNRPECGRKTREL